MGQHQGRTPAAGNHVGHGVGLAGAGHAQQGLEHQTVVDALHQLADRLRLVAARLERLMEPERAPVEKHYAPAVGLIGHDKISNSSQSVKSGPSFGQPRIIAQRQAQSAPHPSPLLETP
jgi:hypothetical protein